MTARRTPPSRSSSPGKGRGPRDDRTEDPLAPPTPSDHDLVAAINNGDQNALATLLTRHQDRLYAVIFRMVSNPETAADLTQDAMVKIIQGLPTWDARAALTTWMIRVAMNVTLSHLRAQKLRRHASIEGLSETGGRAARHAMPRSRGGTRGSGRPASLEQHREPDGPSSVQKEELRERVAGALAALEPDQRAILILRDMQDFDYEQIAAVLDVAVGTVKSRLFRARAALRQALETGTTPPGNNPGADLRRSPDETA